MCWPTRSATTGLMSTPWPDPQQLRRGCRNTSQASLLHDDLDGGAQVVSTVIEQDRLSVGTVESSVDCQDQFSPRKPGEYSSDGLPRSEEDLRHSSESRHDGDLLNQTVAVARTSKGYQRAAVCIGVDRVGGLPPLGAAASGAVNMADWAQEQGCDVVVHTDRVDGSVVNRREIFDSVRDLVDRRIYDQLIVYFAGHGLLMAPGAEVWLLSDAAADSTEAVNALLTAEHARRAGIPHVALISDACRTYVNGPPFYGLSGGSIFPSPAGDHDSADLDIYFGTAPGNPAYEIKAESQPGYGVFTRCLLDVLTQPPHDIIEYVDPGPYPGIETMSDEAFPVVTSRKLKPPLIEAVAEHAARINPLLDQRPEIRVETVLPRFFGTVEDAQPRNESVQGTNSTPPTRGINATAAAWSSRIASGIRRRRSVSQPKIPDPEVRIRQLADSLQADWDGSDSEHPDFAWIVVRGAEIHEVTAVGWEIADQQQHGRDLHRYKVIPAGPHAFAGTSAVLQFHDGTGTLVAIVPRSTATVIVNDGRVAAMDYQTSFRADFAYPRDDRRRLAELATVIDAAQNGDLAPALNAFVDSQFRGTSAPYQTDNMVPVTLRAYGAAERGRDVSDLFYRSFYDRVLTFDLALLASRSSTTSARIVGSVDAAFAEDSVLPFAPLMTRGWLLLGDNPTPAREYHALLARHLVPALWTTLDAGGVDIALDVLFEGGDR